MNNLFYSTYVCPVTRTALRVDGESLNSERGQIYPLHNGIPNFLRFGPCLELDDEAHFQRLNRLAIAEGWLGALKETYSESQGMIHYVTENTRASFIDILPITEASDVLEIGPGLGQMTGVLAKKARSVAALEVVPGQAEFVAIRCRQEGLTNVRVAVGGDDCYLPYRDASFDVVVLNLVFEWCASRCLEESPDALQRRLLAEMMRVLRPGGALYLSTKNRYALKYLIGKSDEHMHQLRWGSALPRCISAAIVKAKGLPRAPGRLHSHSALSRMLRDAGFDELRSYWAAPEIRFPMAYVPTDVPSIRAARRQPEFQQGDIRSVKVLMPLVPAVMVKHVSAGLTFLAWKRSG